VADRRWVPVDGISPRAWLALVLLLGIFQGSARAERRPNILLILADDLGWSDLRCYGGEIRTSTLDALAEGGLRLTQFYNSARCSPSRAALLTGLHPHQAGVPNLGGNLNDRCVTLAEALAPAGYDRFMSGKWHVGQPGPIARGFQEFYGFVEGHSVDCWDEDAMVRLPAGHPKRSYPPGTFYATDAITDHALDFLAGARRTPDRPWFLYVAYNAPHFPLHAPREDIAKYEALYAQGWDRIRERRLARQKELGLVPKDLALTPRSVIPANHFNVQTGWADKDNPAWDTLPADRRADLARRMAVFAAMVDYMDRSIARLVAELRSTGQFEDTVILFLSDNGACAEWDPFGFDGTSGPRNVLHWGDDLAKVGGPGSYISYGSGWANASNTPWRLYKHYNHEGGIATPFIAHWPAGLKRRGELDARPSYLTDVLPTCLELAGAAYPLRHDGHEILPPEGVSLLTAFRGEPAKPRLLFIEHEGNRAVRDGAYKLVALQGKPWELYHIETDRGELNDLADQQPGRVERLARAWDEWARRCNVGPNRRDSAASTGRGDTVATPQIAGKALTISCEVEPRSRDGVVLAQGGNQHGYALYLSAGRLAFSVRVNRQVTTILSTETPSGRFAVTARLNRDASMQLLINDRVVAEGQSSGLIPVQPEDELSIGEDSRTAVGDYPPPHPLRGTISDVRVVPE
jgi:arylsulfatase